MICQPTLANLLCFRANFNCCKWQKLSTPSCRLVTLVTLLGINFNFLKRAKRTHQDKEIELGAVVVAQLPIPDVRGSNPVIGNNLY